LSSVFTQVVAAVMLIMHRGCI